MFDISNVVNIERKVIIEIVKNYLTVLSFFLFNIISLDRIGGS